VLAQDRDRFAREPAYHYLLRREFEEHGIKLRALNDHGGESPEGELTDGILDQLAKYERAKIVERSRRGKLRKAREGKVIATYRPTHGFRINAARDGYEVDEEKMAVVRRVFRMVGSKGAGIYSVQRPWSGKGYRRRAGASTGTSARSSAGSSTTPTGRTRTRRSQDWCALRWRPAWTRRSPTASGGLTAGAPR
jgi:site-specific DNA recombinase